VFDAKQALDDPHLEARGFFQELDHSAMSRRQYPGPPLRDSGHPPELRSGPPLLGEHNREVLCDVAGLSTLEYEQLVEAGIVGTEFRPGIL
jgi:crotonobetainyl-CoA:carnitine CoA-transferase CaiB-like acyl-CoA transferase